MSKRTLWPLLTALLLLLLAAGCTGGGVKTTVPPATAATPLAGSQTPAADATAPPPAPGQLPATLRLQPAATALPDACQQSVRRFSLDGVDLPRELEPGVDYLFCARGAEAGSTVIFTLTGPEDLRLVYEAASATQGDTTVAPLTLRLNADARPGRWTLTAAAGDAKADLALRLAAPTAPFIALTESPGDNPGLIRAGIGGLPPDSRASFALYRLVEDASGGDEGAILISLPLSADAAGRADLELDVADLPAGRYLLVLLPEGAELGDAASLSAAGLGRLAVATAITRPAGVVSGPEAGGGVSVPVGGLPPAPQPAASGGGLPEAVQFNFAPAQLPVCPPAEAPALQLWPDAGEIGNWWLGCANGFPANETIDIVVTAPTGQTTTIPVTASANGAAPFRWYSAPGEGVGEYQAVATSAGGATATIAWSIASPTRPHVLVFAHNYPSAVGGELYLSGFPANSKVDLGLYSLDAQGKGTLVKQWQLDLNRFGALSKPFEEAFGLDTGQYAVVVQGGPAFTFAGLDLAASAFDFFGYDEELDPRYDVYTLYLNRAPGAVAQATPAAEPTPTNGPTPAAGEVITPTVAAPAPPDQIPPAVVSIPEDNSPQPTCPGAAPDAPSICLLPTTLERGAFAYLMAHGFPAGTRIDVSVRTPKGQRVAISDQTDAQGFADFHWFALNDEPLGEYKVTARGGGQTFEGSFTVVAAASPHLVVQPRTAPIDATSIIVSVAGFQPTENLIVARYRSAGASGGVLNFELVDTIALQTGAGGGAQKTVATPRARAGDIYLLAVYRPDQGEALAQAVYSIGQPLYLRYAFAWGQNFQEGQ
ncbi:MAG: hypothetical protein K1X65_00075 [Caldilineales bacterium]|nr:hypothetical protein [Caldilineales bacterium]MCW5857667.1 hypothetical protein [Caldilineales bacterium]